MGAKAAYLDRAEWDFAFFLSMQEEPSDQRLFLCHLYEFTREIPHIREGVRELREQGKLEGHGIFSGLLKIKHWPELPLRAAIKYPYPQTAQQTDVNKPFKKLADEILAAVIDPGTNYSQTPRKVIELAIPEMCSHEQLRACFAAHLRLYFPTQGKRGKGPRNAGIGAGAPIRKIKQELKALGAYRLLRKMTANEASAYTEKLLSKPLFESEKSWSEAKGRAKRRIEFYIKEAPGFPFFGRRVV